MTMNPVTEKEALKIFRKRYGARQMANGKTFDESQNETYMNNLGKILVAAAKEYSESEVSCHIISLFAQNPSTDDGTAIGVNLDYFLK